MFLTLIGETFSFINEYLMYRGIYVEENSEFEFSDLLPVNMRVLVLFLSLTIHSLILVVVGLGVGLNF